MAMHLRLAVVLLSSVALSAQQAITTRFGPRLNARTGDVVRTIGDFDGDGRGDFLVSSSTRPGAVQLFSGRTRAVLTTFTDNTYSLGTDDVVALGDVNLDGRGDFAISENGLQVYSGATGARLWQIGAPISYGFVAAAGDLDSDGRADLATIVLINSDRYLWSLSGLNGGQIAGLATRLQPLPTALESLGDVNGDGRSEVVIMSDRSLTICSLAPMAVLRTITDSTTQFERVQAADMDGDGRKEILVSTNIAIRVYSATTGALLRSYANRFGLFAVLGDLNADGVPDFANLSDYFDTSRGVPYRRVFLCSGLDGSTLGVWSASYEMPLADADMAGVGDVDGDGQGDLLLGDVHAGIDQQNPTGGWQLVSGRVLATMQSIPVQCGGGPFFPQLGITRPVLGQTLSMVGRDCPPQAWGTVVLSMQPAHERNLGVTGCDAWLDFGSWTALYLPPQGSSWQLTLPLPNVPQLAGLGVALQMVYGPTTSPIGFDLSNAIWARFGY